MTAIFVSKKWGAVHSIIFNILDSEESIVISGDAEYNSNGYAELEELLALAKRKALNIDSIIADIQDSLEGEKVIGIEKSKIVPASPEDIPF